MQPNPTHVSADVAALDQALDRLRQPTTVHDRLGILQQLVEFWHGPSRPEDGMTDAEMTSLPLPLPLRWWYRWAGKRSEILSGQNILFVPRDFQNKHNMLQVTNGRVLFYVENQGVYQWSTLQHGDDPPVFGRYEGRGRWAKEGVTLSEHLILMCLFEAVMCHAKYEASAAWLEEGKLREIVRHIPPLAIGRWRWGKTTFFAGRGAFMNAAEQRVADGKKGYYSVWIGAKTPDPLQFLKPLVDKSWEHVAL
jgi:hypothetical protein